MRLVKALLIGSLVFGTVSPVRAEMTPSERTLIAQEDVLVSQAATMVALLNINLTRNPNKYVEDLPNLIKYWDSFPKYTYAENKQLRYLDKAVNAHRTILTLLQIRELTPKIIFFFRDEAVANLNNYLNTPAYGEAK